MRLSRYFCNETVFHFRHTFAAKIVRRISDILSVRPLSAFCFVDCLDPQGKFQLVVLPACGHTVQEDAPERVAATLLEFVGRRANEFMKIAALNARLRK
jgi:hypothetical protein